MINYVIINGVNSNTKNGLMINELPPISKPQMRTDIEEIDGRDGDIITKLGYSAYDKTITIGLWGTSYDVNDIIAFFNKEGIITFSNEPDKYYKFTMLDDFDIETLLRFKTASITFHCQPYKYPTNETPIEIEYEYIEQDNVESASLNNTNGDSHLDITLKGNTSQYTTTGKNKFDGIFRQGSASETTSAGVIFNQNNIFLQAGTYTFSNDLTSSFNYAILGNTEEYPTSNENTYNSGWKTGNFTFTISQDLYIGILIKKTSGNITPSDVSSYEMQLELGSSATNWEEYSGGIPAPNPSYPQQIHEVSGDNEVVVCGKNLFDYDTYISNSTFKFSVIGGATLYRNGNIGNLTKWKIYDENNNYISDMSPFPSTGTFTIPNNAKYIEVNNDTGLTSELYIGYSSNTTYEPYQSQTYPIYLGVENLFDKDNANVLNNYFINGSGKITSDSGNTTIYVKIQPNTKYTISKIADNVFRVGTCQNTPTENTQLNNYIDNAIGTSITLTSNLNDNYLCVFLRNSSSSKTLTELYDSLQISKGEKTSTYYPYGTTPIELCKIGDYQDYFYKDSGKWYLHKEIGKVVLDGSEDGWYISSESGRYSYYIRNSSLSNCLDERYTKYCDNFKYTNTSYAEAPIPSLCENSGTVKMFIFNTDGSQGTTLAQFKTWLSTHNTIVYYVLATPYLSLIEDETLISQLDNIQNAMSYEGQTNVSQVNNDKAFIMDLIAMKDGTDEVVVNNIGNTYSKPTIALEGTGDINIYLNGMQMLKATLTDKMTIDTTNLEAYNPDTMTLLNRQLVGDISKFTLSSGNNTIKVDGNLTKATITDYVRYL